MSIPEGFKLVPVEPTVAMEDAAAPECGGYCPRCDNDMQIKTGMQVDIYRTMLAAAPTPPQPIFDEAKERELFESFAVNRRGGYGNLPFFVFARKENGQYSDGTAEPVAWRVTGRGSLTVTPEYPKWAVGERGLTTTPLYAEQPAPVAVPRLEMAHVVRAHLEIPGCPVLTSNQCHGLAMKLNACLDEVTRLNAGAVAAVRICDCNQGRLPCNGDA